MPVYVYMDESGSPGKAQCKNDYFLVAVTIFDDLESVEDVGRMIAVYRKKNNLSADYEFHRSTNSKKVREGFGRLIEQIDFRFITAYAKKGDDASTTSYDTIASEIIDKLSKKILSKEIKH